MEKPESINLQKQVETAINQFLKEKYGKGKFYRCVYSNGGLLQIDEYIYDHLEISNNKIFIWNKRGQFGCVTPICEFERVYFDKPALEKYVNTYNCEKLNERIKQLQDSLDNFDKQANEIKEKTKSELSKYQNELKKLNKTKESKNE